MQGVLIVILLMRIQLATHWPLDVPPKVLPGNWDKNIQRSLNLQGHMGIREWEEEGTVCTCMCYREGLEGRSMNKISLGIGIRVAVQSIQHLHPQQYYHSLSCCAMPSVYFSELKYGSRESRGVSDYQPSISCAALHYPQTDELELKLCLS